jgi:hypothetical protein
VGHGAAVWLRVTPAASTISVLSVPPRTVTPDDARAPRALRIGETGQVPLIEVENRGAEPWLLPAHVVLAGGWQTRSVERSVIVGGGGSARVPVKCVEAGRWAPRDDGSAASFEITDHTSVRARWSTSRSMAEQLHRTGHFAAEQSVVWQHVDEELSRSPVGSRTRSYEAYLRGVRQPFVAEAKRAGITPAPGANAVAILPRGGGFWIEAYPTPEALAARADDLLADLFDPASAAGPKRDDDPSLLPELDALLESLWAMPLRLLEPIAGTLGDTFAFAGDTASSAAGAALVTGGALAHLSVGAPPATRSASGAGARGAERSGLRGGDGAGGDALGSGLRSSLGARSAPAVSASAGGNDSGALERPRVDLDTMRGIYARARDLLPEGPLARERVHGYRLVRVLDRNISWVDVRLGGDGYAVLGSHDRCDLVLSSDSGVWLRHLAAICVRLDDDSIGLRLIDLKTDLPFFLDDDTPRWSVLATGPFAMRIGRHVVCGFPIGAATADDPSSPSPAGARATRVAAEAGASPRAIDPMATGVVETGVTRSPSADLRLGPVVPPAPGATVGEITSFVPSAPVSQIQDLLGPSTSANQVRVTLERGGMGASVELPLDALEAGVLLGRALNCFDGGLRRIFCEAISRAHVLLLRDHGEVSAYDLCSTNGTRVGGQRIRRFRLADAGSTLELGKKVVFRWRR